MNKVEAERQTHRARVQQLEQELAATKLQVSITQVVEGIAQVGESMPMSAQVSELKQKLEAAPRSSRRERTGRVKHMGDYVVVERNRRRTFRIIPYV